MEAGRKWSFKKDELLVKLVRHRPCLYNLQSSHYSDSSYKRKEWNDIEKLVGQSGAKIRWESLRSQYRKYLRTREPKLKDKSGLAAVRISKWRLYDQMAFLRKFINNDRPQSSSITDDEISNENVRDTDTVKEELEKTSIRQDNDIEETEVNNEYVNTFTNNIPSIKKRNNNKANATVQQENVSSTLMKYILQKKEECGVHPIDKFFSLMATTVKNFSAADQHSVKTKVFALVSEIEEKYLTIPPSPVLQASS